MHAGVLNLIQQVYKEVFIYRRSWWKVLNACQKLRSNPYETELNAEKNHFKLECYCCKQQLKDSNLTFTLTLKVNKCCSAHGFKNKSLRTDKVNQTAQSTVKSSNFHAFRPQCPHILFIAHLCRKKK